MGDDLNWAGHVDRMVGKTSRILGMLKRTFVSRDLGFWKERKHVEGGVEKIEIFH